MQEAPNRQHQSQLQRVTVIASEMYREPDTLTFGLKLGWNPELASAIWPHPARHHSDFTDNNDCATIKPTSEHFTPALTNLLILEHSYPWGSPHGVAFYGLSELCSFPLLSNTPADCPSRTTQAAPTFWLCECSAQVWV